MAATQAGLVFAVHNYQQGIQRLCAACDEDLLGGQYAEGKLRLDVKPEFYDGMRVDADALTAMMRQCTIANLVGPNTIALAIEIGLIDAKNVMHVDGVPHAQMVVL